VVERKRVFDSVSYELEHYNPAYVGALRGCDAGPKIPADQSHWGMGMSFAAACRTLIAALAFAGLAAAMPAHADPQGGTEVVADPTLRPNTAGPAYPPQSRKNMEAGVVRIRLCVEADGRVSKADLAETSGFPNLDNAVLKWAKDVRFNPAMKGSTPVALCDFAVKHEFQVTKGPTKQQQTNNAFDIGPATGLAGGP
jgi:TonB family protein